jgi:hypothetical protein
MESVITLRCNRISAIAFDLTGTNTVIAVLLAPALYIPQDNFWRGEKDVACTTANTVLHYIYSNGKKFTIFIPGRNKQSRIYSSKKKYSGVFYNQLSKGTFTKEQVRAQYTYFC